MGRNHLRTYLGIPDIELVAISDANANLSESVGNEFKIKYYSDFREMIEKEKPDIISVCVPTIFHFEVAKFCIENGANILLEKPIAPKVEEAEEILELAKKNNAKILIGHIERFNPAVKKVKEMIEKGE